MRTFRWRWLGSHGKQERYLRKGLIRPSRELIFLFTLLISASGLDFCARIPVALAQGSYLPESATARELKLYMSSGRLLQLEAPATTMFVADPTIADIQLPAPDRVFIYGKKPGRTTFFALRADGTQAESFNVAVTYNVDDLNRFLRAQAGDLPLEVVETPQGIVLGGVVPNAETAERVKSIVTRLAGDGNPVISNLRVSGSMQVSIHVRIAEITRNVMKNLGVNWGVTASTGVFSFGLISSASASSRGTNITALIDALASQGLVSILAEPTLTAVSGEKASFLAGGEFPIPISQSASNNISVEYRKYGVSLDFTPTVLSERLVSLSVKPEVSDISPEGAVSLNNIQIPALTTRRAETTVELGSGESLVIGGLIQNRFNTEIEKIPGAGDVPVLGALFRSTQFKKNESELVIIVTPYLVRPASNPNAFRLPTDKVAPASDIERILWGKLAAGQALEGGKPPAKLRGDPGFILK